MIHGSTRLGPQSNVPGIKLKPPFMCIYLILKQYHLSLNISRAPGSVFTVSPLGIHELFLALECNISLPHTANCLSFLCWSLLQSLTLVCRVGPCWSSAGGAPGATHLYFSKLGFFFLICKMEIPILFCDT